MAVLDLQGLKTKRDESDGAKGGRKSGASKGCAPSGLSLLIC
jgi:hypothetical protein